LVAWIWIGVGILIFGSMISLWPEFSFGRVGAWEMVRAGATASATIALSIYVAMAPAMAHATTKPRSSVAATMPSPSSALGDVLRAGTTAPVALSLLAGGLIGVLHGRRRRFASQTRASVEP
jgi:hypothetical protein